MPARPPRRTGLAALPAAVDRTILKRGEKLVPDLSGPRRDVEASRDYLVGTFGTPEPGWLPGKVTA